VYWLLLGSFQQEIAFFTYPPPFLAKFFTSAPYLKSFADGRIVLWIRNTSIVTVAVVVFTVVVGSLAAYGFARFRFAWKNLFLLLILTTQMIPEVLAVTPLYITFRQWGLINTFPGLIIADLGLALPLSIWIFMGFFTTIPRAIEEAAMIDGCSRLGVLFRIVLPLSTPALITIAALTFFATWNEYVFALTFIDDPNKWLGTVGIASFIGEHTTSLNTMMSSSVLFLVTPVFIYAFLQKYIVSGITRGGVKG